MEIKSLTATFGKLENSTLRLHSGLNILEAPNESGKSTWCAFIRAMLYGVDSAQRAKGGMLPDKQKYLPWSGLPMEGSMDLTVNGTPITLTRTTKNHNAPMRELKITYTGTDRRVEGVDLSNPGLQFTGVSSEVFRRSAFIEQGTIAISESPELEKRIAAIVSSGEEDVSFSEADNRLRAQLRKRRYNRSGTLPEMEVQMDELRLKLNGMQDGTQRLETLEKQQETDKQTLSQLEERIVLCRKTMRKTALDSLNRSNRELENSRRELDKTVQKGLEIREKLREGVFAELEPQQAERQLKADTRKYEALETALEAKNPPFALFATLCFALTLVLMGLYFKLKSLPLIIAGALLLSAGGFFIACFLKIRGTKHNAEKELRSILKKYGIINIGELENLLDEYMTLQSEYEQTAEREKTLRERCDGYALILEKLQKNVVESLDFSVTGTGEASQLSRQLKELQTRVNDRNREISALRAVLQDRGSLPVMESRLSYLEEQYDRVTDEYDAIALAESVLCQADEELQSRFAPLLSKKAAEYMTFLTDGKYDDVLIGRDFKALAREDSRPVARESSYLSAGTADLLYLAIRLAVCSLTMPEKETCPLIIDDALVNMDNERSARVLELLEQLSRDRQIILFSCRKLQLSSNT